MSMEYIRNAMGVRDGEVTGRGAILLADTMKRLEAGIFGKNKAPRCLMDAAWIDAGYALDAPEQLPAGGCTGFTLQGFDEMYPDDPMAGVCAEQITVQRESQAAASGVEGKQR